MKHTKIQSLLRGTFRAALSPALAILVMAPIGLSAACGSNDHGAATPTNAVCPADSTLTYENFGAPFMESFCTRCHSSALVGTQRQGAPLYHDFDTLTGILNVANHVDWYTAAGPSSTNELMPPDGAIPTLEERTLLGEWLACEVENLGR